MKKLSNSWTLHIILIELLFIFIAMKYLLLLVSFTTQAAGGIRPNYKMYDNISLFNKEQQVLINKILYHEREIINKTIVFNDTKTK